MKKNIYIIIALVAFSNFLFSQATNEHLWVNEFHYDGISDYGTSDQGEFVELIIHNDLLNDATELAKYELVLYTIGASVQTTLDNPLGTGVPYSAKGRWFTEADTRHNLAAEDANQITGFQRCPVGGTNYTVLSKQMTNLMDLPTAFVILYNDAIVVQNISYEKSFTIKNTAVSGGAAGTTTELIETSLGAPADETFQTSNDHSIQLQGTGNKYGDFNWTDDLDAAPVTTSSPCAVNTGQVISNLGTLPDPPLAIDLIDLTATPQQNAILLDWATSKETDNAGFYIQRRAAGEAQFKTLDFVKGAGTSSTDRAYSYLDTDVKNGQTYYYQLRQEDFNGKISYSKVVMARLIGKDLVMQVAPNPATDRVQITLENINETATLQITGLDGRVIQQAKLEAATTRNIQLDVSQWPKGIYMLRLESNENVLTQKLSIY